MIKLGHRIFCAIPTHIREIDFVERISAVNIMQVIRGCVQVVDAWPISCTRDNGLGKD